MEAPAGPRSEFRLLGPVEARRDGRSLPLGGQRQEALLTLLLLARGRPVSVDRLADELWAGEPPAGAATTIRSYVSRLRAALGDAPAITAGSTGYAIEVGPDAVDVWQFEGLVRDAEAAIGRRATSRAHALSLAALGLWGGQPFGTLAVDGSLRIEAERLAELRLRALEIRLEADLALGGGAALIDELEALVREHPFRERFWEHLMLACYRAGRQADALEAYRRARHQLSEHLGLEPGQALQRLQGQILRHEVEAPASPAADTLPSPLTTFVGRVAELATVAQLLAASRLVTLVGVGGVGKTRLALEAARARVQDHPDGVWLVDLAPIADPAIVPGHAARVLGIPERPGVLPVDGLVERLRLADVLLVLDNCEHLREAVAVLTRTLLSSCPSLRILATSREALGVAGEAELQVPPLGLPDDTVAGATARGARDADSVQLFLARARAARPGIADDEATIETIARICADLDGIPLGIELAAARARALSPSEIAARLRDRYQFLVAWRRLAAARHRTLREAMDWSYDLLGPGEQRMLRRISVFAGGFTLDAAAAVAEDGDVDRALERVERLVEASLVTVDGTVEPTRYGVLETVRQYGAGLLADAGETAEVRRLHAAHFTGYAVAAWGPLRNAWVRAGWAERTARDSDNLRAAMTWQDEAGERDDKLRIAESLWWFWWIRGEPGEGRRWLESALEGAPDAGPLLRARAHLGVGGLAWVQGDFETARVHAEHARSLFAELGDALQEGSALNTLGLIASGRGENTRARAMFEAAIERFRVAGDDPELVGHNLAVAIDNLGSSARDLGDDDAALTYYREALALNQARGDAEAVAMNELHLAVLNAEQGRFAEAGGLLARALAVYRAVGFRQYAAECLEAGAVIANGTGSPAQAAFLLGAAARLRDDAATPPVPLMARLRERETAAAEAALGAEGFAAISDEARRLPSDDALRQAADSLGAG